MGSPFHTCLQWRLALKSNSVINTHFCSSPYVEQVAQLSLGKADRERVSEGQYTIACSV